MNKNDCKARLHLLGFETTDNLLKLDFKERYKSNYCFVFTKTKKGFLGYLASNTHFMIPNYFSVYEQMIAKALELNANDKN